MCNGRTLVMGPNEDIDITKVTGLESSELEISTSDNALVDGVSVDGKKISKRPIHIEAKFKKNKNNPENRAAVIKFFNPKYTGKALITNMGISRNINYELEGWTFAEQQNLDARLGIIVDLMCPDPYMLNVDNFGKNMAHYTAQFHFPWHSLAKRATNKKDYPEQARGLISGGAGLWKDHKKTSYPERHRGIRPSYFFRHPSPGACFHPVSLLKSKGEYISHTNS